VSLAVRSIDFTSVPIAIALVDGLPPEPEPIPEVRVPMEEHLSTCEAAYQKGFQEANDHLANQILEQRAEIAQLQDSLFLSLSKQHAVLAEQVSETLPDLAIEIVQRVLAGMKPDREAVERLLAETLAEIAPGSTDVEVFLSAPDLELVERIMKDYEHKYPGIKLTADPELLPGDCRAKSRFGMIDARVFTKLQNVARSLK
jgi:flagellar biosynthesis/type III secretory pathway protein FliH